MAGKTKRLTINVTDKNGNKTSETRDIYARGLWNTQEIKITGAVEGHGVTDFEDGKGVQFAVTQGKDSVGNDALQSGAVTLDKISDSAKNGTIQDNDNKLATHAQVKTYVDAAVTGKGTYLGKKSVAEINALDASKLNNSDRVMTSDGGTITLGGFDVIAGTDLILYKDGSTIRWDSMDGNFKTKQSVVVDPAASGASLEFISNISQNENGVINAEKKSVDLSNIEAKTADSLKVHSIRNWNDGTKVYRIGRVKVLPSNNYVAGGGSLSFASRDVYSINTSGQIYINYSGISVLHISRAKVSWGENFRLYYLAIDNYFDVYLLLGSWAEVDFVENVFVSNHFNFILEEAVAIPEGAVEAKYKYNVSVDSAIGSTTVPVYVDYNGNLIACTDDFVHDGDVLKQMDTSSDKPIAAAAVNAAIQNAIGGQATFGGEKTIAELNDIMTAGNVPSGTYYIVGGSSSGRLNNPDGSYIEVDPGNQVTIFNPEGSAQDKWFKNSAGKANDNMLGLVKTSSVDGGVSLDSNGKMQVNGWSDVAKKTDVTQEISNAITSEATARQDAIDNYVMFTTDEVESMWNEVMAV